MPPISIKGDQITHSPLKKFVFIDFSINPFHTKPGIFLPNWVNIMPADALAPYVAMSSAGMILITISSICFMFFQHEFHFIKFIVAQWCHIRIIELYQHWFKLGLVAWQHQAITWTCADWSSVKSPVAYFTKEVNPRLANCPLVFNGCLANRGLTSLVKEATGVHQRAISQETLEISALDMSLKITNLQLQPYFQEANEFKWSGM